MKTPTGRLSFQSAFSLVELLVVIAVIAVIAAIAIPNIAGITQNAAKTSGLRNAQNLASISSAAIAAGATKANMGADKAAVIATLTNGLTVTNGSITNGPFRVDGLPTDAASMALVTTNLTYDSTTGGLIYKPAP